ncbi:MAG: IS110 family transposase [Holophagaceae bacterium]|nr:IS110 family transposase [Holophagaceae bacterium]
MPDVHNPTRWLGVDVAKATFHAALARADLDARPPTREFARSPDGARECLAWAASLAPGTPLAAVMEATGGYSEPLAAWLRGLRPELPVAIVNPRWVKHYGLSLGVRDKTDRVDAIVLATFGQERHPSAHVPMSETYSVLHAMVREREALLKAALATENRDELPSRSAVAQEVRGAIIREMKAGIQRLDAAILAHIKADENLHADYRILVSIAGIGPVVASGIMGELGDLRRFEDARKLSSFVGLAPKHRRSGTSVNAPPRMSKQGNPRIRRLLYMSALTVIRGDNDLAVIYRSDITRGKPPKVALVGIMRRLMVLMRALLVENRPFERHHTKAWPEEVQAD